MRIRPAPPQPAIRRLWLILLAFAPLTPCPCLAAPPDHAEWDLTFEDQFAGDTVDWTVWESQAGPRGSDHLEGRWPQNNLVEDGVLNQMTREEQPPRGGKDWSTAHIWTRTFRQTYGYFEARIRYGRYLNNAFWLWRPAGSNPKPHFEIDVNEGHTPREMAMTLHFYHYYPDDPVGDLCSTGRRWDAPVDLDQDFHLYGLEWNQEELVWTFDGQPVRRLRNAVCHAPVGIRLSTVIMARALAKDGVDLQTMNGVGMTVDWVRAYRRTRLLYQPERPDLEVYEPPTVVASSPRVAKTGSRTLLHSQTFEDTPAASLPVRWEVGDKTPRVALSPRGAAAAQDRLGRRALELTPGAYAFRLLERPVSGRMEVEFDYCSPLKGDGLLFVTLGSFDRSHAEARRSSYYTGDIGPYVHWSRRFVRYYTETEKWTPIARRQDDWGHVRIVLDIAGAGFDVYGGQDGKAFLGSGPFRHSQKTAQGIGFRHRGNSGTVYVDNVSVRLLED